MYLTIVYTGNIHGDIQQLPRLYTLLRPLIAQSTAPYLLLDSGHACVSDVWHCDVTEGRSMLLVMDAMGYHVANVIGYLTEAGKAKLMENLLRMSMLLEGEEWMRDNVWVTTDEHATPDDWPLQIVLLPAPETKLDQRILYLETVISGQVGVVRLGPAAGNRRLTILDSTIHTLSPATLPDPTIAATVDFVLSEARRYQQRRDED